MAQIVNNHISKATGPIFKIFFVLFHFERTSTYQIETKSDDP